MSDDIVTRLRDHERHAVHDLDDDCAEAADAIEGLARDLHETRLLADRLTRERDELAAQARNDRCELLADIERLERARDEAYAAGRAEVTSAAKEIVRLRAELERWKDAADEQAGPIQALMEKNDQLTHENEVARRLVFDMNVVWADTRNERNELLTEVVKLRARVRELEANGPDPLGGRMDV